MCHNGRCLSLSEFRSVVWDPADDPLAIIPEAMLADENSASVARLITSSYCKSTIEDRCHYIIIPSYHSFREFTVKISHVQAGSELPEISYFNESVRLTDPKTNGSTYSF